MDVIFQTERLSARPLTVDDADAAFAVYGDPEVMRHVTSDGEAIPDASVVRMLIEGGMLAPQPDPRFGFWALTRRSDDALVGTVALIEVEDSEGEHELGWHLARAHWGQGYARESGVALLEHAFGTAGLDRVLALARPQNERSLRACERIGMTRAGTRMSQGSEHACFVAERATWRAPD